MPDIQTGDQTHIVTTTQDSANELARQRAEGLNVDTPPQPRQQPPQAPPQAPQVSDDQVQSMLQKYEGDPQKMAQALAHLNSMQSRPAEQPQQQPGDTLQIGKKNDGPLDGLDLEKITAELVQNDGKLTDETRADLEARGIPKKMVDTHVQGILAIREMQTQTILGAFGGEQAWKEISSWAESNAPADVVDEFNAALQTNDSTRQRAAVHHLKTLYQTSSAGQQTLVQGIQGGAGFHSGYTSRSEMLKAMSDQRYVGGDEQYIRDVEAKVAASDPNLI